MCRVFRLRPVTGSRRRRCSQTWTMTARREVIAGSTDGNLYVWKGDGSLYPGFPVRLGSELRSAAALTDAVNPQIAVLASDGNLFLVNLDGTIASGFPKSLGTGSLYTYAAPVVGDVDRDGNKGIVCVVSGGYDYKIVVAGLDGSIRYHSQTRIRNPFYGSPALGTSTWTAIWNRCSRPRTASTRSTGMEHS